VHAFFLSEHIQGKLIPLVQRNKEIGAKKVTKTIEALVENYQPKNYAEAEVCEVLMEAMDQYPDLKKMEMDAGPSDKSMVEEGYGEGGYESDPVEGIKSAFKAAMMKVLDDDSLDAPGKLAKLKLMLAVSDKASEAMAGQAPAMQGEGGEMDAEMEESYKRKIASLEEKLHRSSCKELLIESQVEPSEVKIKALLPLQESERVELVKTWRGSTLGAKRPVRTGSVMTESAAVQYPSSVEEFSRLLG